MAKKRITLRAWRVSEAAPSGLSVWFDPDREYVEIYELEPLPEDGVGECSEGDDQRSLGLFPRSTIEGHLEDDLPF